MEAAGRIRGNGRIARIVGVSLCAAVVLAAAACGDISRDRSDGSAGEALFDVASLEWEPATLEQAMPALVGWEQPVGDAPGRLVALAEGDEPTVLWQTPDEQDLWIRIEEVDPDGPQMVGVGSAGVPDGRNGHALVFRSDGSVESLSFPEGYEGMADVAFMGRDILVVAYHATREAFTTVLGAVDAEGTWHHLTLEGELPEYQFVERLAVLPGTDTVGLVLKTPGGTGNRDDDALVLARREGSALKVVSGVYRDDSLVGCVPLRDGEGVAFGRTWSGDGASRSSYVRAEWTGSEWIESELASPEEAPVPVEMGEVITQDSTGAYLVRRAENDADRATSHMVRLKGAGSAPEPVGVDLTDIVWYVWLEPQAQ